MELHKLRLRVLIFTAVLFCLPWMQIRCNIPNGGTIISTQSGFQSMYGGHSVRTEGKNISEATRKDAELQAERRQKPAWLMVLYAVCLVGAIAASFLVSEKQRQWLIVAGFSAAAAACFLIQLALGFPMVEGLHRGKSGWQYTFWFWCALAFTMGSFLIVIGEKLKAAQGPRGSEGGEPADSGDGDPDNL